MKLLLAFVGILVTVSALDVYPLLHPYYYGYGQRSQYHTQDSLGQYAFGYSGGPSTRNEVRSLDGSVHGSYSYIDANGIQQTRNYRAHPLFGFQVAGTDIPVAPKPVEVAPLVEHNRKRRSVVLEDPEVRKATWEHEQAHLRVLAGLPAIPEGGFTYPYPLDVQEVNEAKANFINEYGKAIQRNLGYYYSGVPLDTSAVLIAKAKHQQAHADALARLSGTYVPSAQVYNTEEVNALTALHHLAHADLKLRGGH